MAARGVNGAVAATLNARFIKCAGCKVNVPKEDMLALGKCTVCGRAYEPEITDGGKSITVETVAFAAGAASAAPAAPTAAAKTNKLRRKRWAVLTSKKGRTYYHNTETGEDTWEAPPDLDAEATEDAFVPFKNDAVKNAVLREQAKAEASRMGVPMEVIAMAQRREQEEELANDPIAQLGSRKVDQPVVAAATAAASKKAAESAKLPPHTEHIDEGEEEAESSDDDEDNDQDEEKQRTCSMM